MRAGPRHLRKALLLSVLTVFTAAIALPASALGQTASNPDSYLYATPINQPNSVLPGTYGPAGGTTVGAGLQSDIFNPPFSGGPGENYGCSANGNTQYYGATQWWRFYPNHTGAVGVRVDGTGFRPVVSIMPIDGNSTPILNYLACLDGNASTGVVILYYPYYVQAGVGYLMQVGAAAPDASGVPSSTGPYSLRFAYDPDSDGDGILDSSDRCASQSGPSGYSGCPDSDGDGIPDPDDHCVNTKGPSSLAGCPEDPDSDGDGRPDSVDRCPREDASARDTNKDGCLDTLLLHRQVNISLNVGAWSRGIVLRKLAVTKVPKGAQVTVTCKLPNHHKCGGIKVKTADVSGVAAILARLGGGPAGIQAHAARDIGVRSLKNKRLPYGTVITIRVTARKATGKYIKLKVIHRGDRIGRSDRCMNVGSAKLRKKGCR
jgi:hypothetical protein